MSTPNRSLEAREAAKPAKAAAPAVTPVRRGAVQRALFIGGLPVRDVAKVAGLCGGLKGWDAAAEAALKAAVESRSDHYEALDVKGLQDAVQHYIDNKAWPAAFTKAIAPADLDKAHQLRQRLAYSRHHRPAPVPMQVPASASAFHQFPRTELVPVADAGYGYARLGEQYVVTHPAAAAPVDPLAFVPFGVNTVPGLGYTAWAGDSTTGRQLGHRMPARKKSKAKAPGRETDDATYGGWPEIPDVGTRGHSEPWQTVSPLIDPVPVKRRKGETWKGTEMFTPTTTSEHPYGFYMENPAFGQGVRKSAVEQPTRTYGSKGWLQINKYAAVPNTVKDKVGTDVPYPDTVYMRVHFAAGTKRKGVTLAADEVVHTKFANAPDVDYTRPETDPLTGAVTFPHKHPAGRSRSKRQQLSKLGAHGTFDAGRIPAADFPVAEVFDPAGYGPFKAGGYGPGEEWPGASPLDAPPSPMLTSGGWEEKPEVLPGRFVPGMVHTDASGDEWHVVEAVFDALTGMTNATLGRERSY